MKLTRIDEAIEVSRVHLDASGAWGTQIEAFLTRYLLVLMCSSFEGEIKRLVIQRSARPLDGQLETFVRSSIGQVFRSVLTGEIAGMLGRFGPTPKESFQQAMKADEKAETFYNNIVTHRHDTAHSSGSQLTFAELVAFYEKGHSVLDAVAEALKT